MEPESDEPTEPQPLIYLALVADLGYDPLAGERVSYGGLVEA